MDTDMFGPIHVCTLIEKYLIASFLYMKILTKAFLELARTLANPIGRRPFQGLASSHKCGWRLQKLSLPTVENPLGSPLHIMMRN